MSSPKIGATFFDGQRITSKEKTMADFVKYTTVKAARKEHICFGCNGTISPGESYNRCFVVDGGNVASDPMCASCMAFMDTKAFEDNFPLGIFYQGELGEVRSELP